jgi:hypothetical protein
MVHMDAATHGDSSVVDSHSEATFLQVKEPMQASEDQDMEHCCEEAGLGNVQGGASSPCIRTTSQMWKQEKVQDVLARVGDYQQLMKSLKEKVAELATRINREHVGLAEEKRTLEVYRKSVRNYGEDLLEDTLALDMLTGLLPEDRNTRKKAIAGLDGVLEEVELLKSALVTLEKDLDSKLASQNEAKTSRSGFSTDVDSPTDALMEFVESPAEDAMDIDNSNEDSLQVNQSEEDTSNDPQLGSSSPLHRTNSQARAQMKLQDVMRRSGDKPGSLQRLKDKISRLVTRMSQDDADLNGEVNVLEDCRKLTRNLGEDLLDDIVALDALSGLLPEDRSNRKALIVSLEGFLEEVDKTKCELAAIKQDLDSKLKHQLELKQAALRKKPRKESLRHSQVLNLQREPFANTDEQLAKQPFQPSRHRMCDGCGQLRSEGCMGDSGFEGDWFCSECWRSWEASDCEENAKPEPHAVTFPENKFWEQLELPLQFQTSGDKNGYTMVSHSCHLQAEEIKLEFSHDASHLTVHGVHLPTNAELKGMQDRIKQHFLRHGKNSFDPGAFLNFYARVGKGSFGSFSETFRLPRDVDVTCISASCDEGVLHVDLPRRMRQTRPFQGHPFFW